MLIAELLNETSDESYKVAVLADITAENLYKFLKKKPHRKSFSIGEIVKELHIDMSINDKINDLLANKTLFYITTDTDLAQYQLLTPTVGFPYTGVILLNLDNIDSKDNTLSLGALISHELQHAIDNSKRSDGKLSGGSVKSAGSLEKYLAIPGEINARFAEILYIIAKLVIPETKFEEFIDKLMDAHELTPKCWPNDPKAQKRFNHLKSRAYKFYMLSQEIRRGLDIDTPVGKKTWLTKIKDLVKKFAYST